MTIWTRFSIALAMALASFHGRAELISLPIPGENWAFTFESQPLTKMPLPFRPRGYAYAGNANRLNVSFFVDPPSCPGGEDNTIRFACFKDRHNRSPLRVPGSLGAAPSPVGLTVVYATELTLRGRTYKMLHMHLLFYREGKEADFHVSFIQPDARDAAELQAMIESVRIVAQ